MTIQLHVETEGGRRRVLAKKPEDPILLADPE